jgi:hypothetical protein
MAKRLPAKSAAPRNEEERTHRTTGINLRSDLWELCNRVAFSRAKRHGGRPSVSALLTDLIERHKKELERELNK